jgi:hypothetical protein
MDRDNRIFIIMNERIFAYDDPGSEMVKSREIMLFISFWYLTSVARIDSSVFTKYIFLFLL